MNFFRKPCVVLMIFLGVFCLLKTATAADEEYVRKAVGKCYVKFKAMQDRCQKLLDRSMEAEGEEEQKLFMAWINCRSEGAEEYDRCRDPETIERAFRNKQWRKANKDALERLGRELEESDDVCSQVADAAYRRCGTKKTDKKKSRCIAGVSKKLHKCLKKGEKTYNRAVKKLNPPD